MRALGNIESNLRWSERFWKTIPLKPEQLPKGTRVAVDANVLIYHFAGLSKQCKGFLLRCQAGEVQGICSSHIALEVLHRLMMLESVERGLATSNPARRMAEAPEKVKILRRSFASFELLESFGLKILSLSPRAISRTPWWSLQYGLLANDAGLLAAMEDHGVVHLITADRQFSEISQVQTWLVDDVV